MRTSASIGGTAAAIGTAALVTWALADDSVSRGGLPAVVWCVIAAFAINWVAFVPAWLQRSEKFFDLTGSITYITVTLLAFFLGERGDWSAVLLLLLVMIWASRLGTFLFRRISRDGHDGRFDKIKTDFWQFFMTWTIQGLWVSLTAAAAWTAMTTLGGSEAGWLTIVGLAIWLLGFGVEVRADSEKSAFRADPANSGRFINTGLWAWSRHPNYFGEITLWIGIALIALPSLDGWEFVALISPVFVTVLLTRISGIPMLARRGLKRWGDEPEYQEYLAKTPLLIPRPPR